MKSAQKILLSIIGLISISNVVQAVDLDLDSYDSIYAACQLLATGLMDYYWGQDYGGTIGMFTHPYYWWEAGGAFGSLIDYGYFFENSTYDAVIIQSMMYQKGDDSNFMPLNQTTTEGNDDQVFWGISAIQAAERNFTEAGGNYPSYLELAQATFNTMKNRWDDDNCGGGLRWQIFTWNNGYDYKNTVSNAGLFHLGARLLRYTGNDSYYLDWCERVYDWLVDVDFVDETLWYAYDGADIVNNSCTQRTSYLWTYNLALMISGCAYMYNYTGEEVWYNRTWGFLKSSSVFFDNYGVMYEATCMPVHTCQTDQRSFRAYLARFLQLTAILVPDTYDTVYAHLKTTAKAVGLSCVGGTDGHTCGMNWSYSGLNPNNYGWDGYYGLGEQMSALEVLQSLVAIDRPAPYTSRDGGSSTGDVTFGNSTTVATVKMLDLDKGDTAGASIITVIVGITIIALGYYVIV
ncbi:hydrolase 76 protein [Pichia californica]|uniref:Mannan endo-1,6-alpha-mannosidase n=1 Tax=Pichia californica TaxID=460514 RepID=A0A9P7BFF4_9ASCO|nr:hydrolase 76 protein [[Candida] californica]KAG0688891.1 hydrolase 76 protein [[Candida] californica]